MTETEAVVLEAAFELSAAQHALDCGMPAQAMKRKAFGALMDACAEHAAENDGELRISEVTP